MRPVHELIFQLEEGQPGRWFNYAIGVLLLAVLAGFFAFRMHKGLVSPEAMDQAQLARNLADGQGYVTQCIRPFALHLLTQYAIRSKRMADPGFGRATATPATAATNQTAIYWPNTMPEVSNPPGYPLLLAAAFKIPFVHEQFKVKAGSGNYRPEWVIVGLNISLLLAAIGLTFFIAHRLFNRSVAWLAAGILAGTELCWHLATAGLPNVWLICLVLGLFVILILLEDAQEQDENTTLRKIMLAGGVGILLGLCALTQYSLLWLGVPVAAYLLLGPWKNRVALCGVALGVMALMVTPWLARNHHLTGTLLGTASYSVQQGTSALPDARLMRSLNPELSSVTPATLMAKFTSNVSRLATKELPLLGGGWLAVLFWLTLVYPFLSDAQRRLRNFLAGSAACLAVVQGLNQTYLTDLGGAVTSENLIALIYPLALVFAVALFVKLLRGLEGDEQAWRGPIVFAVVLLNTMPLLITLWQGDNTRDQRPRINPSVVQGISQWLQPQEMMVSDVPWAVAWYAHHDCLWMPMQLDTEYLPLHQQRPMKGFLLTAWTIDDRFLSAWLRGESKGWGGFVANCLIKRQLPKDFPLPKVFSQLMPDYLFFSDEERWALAK